MTTCSDQVTLSYHLLPLCMPSFVQLCDLSRDHISVLIPCPLQTMTPSPAYCLFRWSTISLVSVDYATLDLTQEWQHHCSNGLNRMMASLRLYLLYMCDNYTCMHRHHLIYGMLHDTTLVLGKLVRRFMLILTSGQPWRSITEIDVHSSATRCRRRAYIMRVRW